MNLKRGVFRFGIVVWFIWFALLAFSEHKSILTFLGVTYWSESSAIERAKNKRLKFDCDRKDRVSAPLECPPPGSYSVSEVISPEFANERTKSVFLLAVVFPAVLFILASALFYLLRWVSRGFSK
jgi:hypothetical protein